MSVRQILITCFIVFFSVGITFAGSIKNFKLNDGSVVSGEIISYNRGVYTVKTASLGTIKIEDANITSIQANPANKTAPAANQGQPSSGSPSINAEIRSIQKSLMSNKDSMKTIMSLQKDPDFQNILKDPVIMKAISSGDISKLMKNQKFLNIMNKSAIKDLQKQSK